MCLCVSAGQAGGEAAGDLQTDAGAAAAGGASSQTDAPPPRGREEEPQRLHEEERRVHRPAGAGEREVRALLSVCAISRLEDQRPKYIIQF